ncbi:MAG TPA: TIR domain-containing protein [Ktedonobacteraceae bacterium]|nr:TIR domain-containing protein [Ktedonobacteraceae bacterium]
MTDTQKTNNSSTSPDPHRNRAFISYSREDHKYLQELHDHLSYYIRTAHLHIWDKTQIQPGANWREETHNALQSTKVAVLLVSTNFFASQAIADDELPSLLNEAHAGNVIILCVILSHCPFNDSELASFQAVNDPSNPLDAMTRTQRNKVWHSVAEHMQKLLSDGEQEIAPLSPQPGINASMGDLSPVGTTKNRHTGPASQPGSTSAVAKQRREQTHTACDVCVICAMDEEVETFIQETTRLCHVDFQSTIGSQTRREYRSTTIQNSSGEPLTLYVTWPPNYGPEETGLHLKAALAELRPRFTAMAGICAANREAAALGDIIVAERAFRSDTGKFTLDRRGRKKQLYDTHTYGPDPDVLQSAQLFDAWKSAVADLPRPISKHQQRDWLLEALLRDDTPCIDDVSLQELRQHAPHWKMLFSELQKGPDPYVNPDGSLYQKETVQKLYRTADFPFKDPLTPRRHLVPMASGSAVRSDRPFEEIRTPVRGAIALDMEGATFYRTVVEFPDTRSLLVKGVSDYADPDKDDSYHQYAAAVSSDYILCFIRAYVTSTRMPRKQM